MKRSPINSLAVQIGQSVASKRKEKGLSQRELARRLGTKQSHLCEIEKGYWRCTAEFLWHVSFELQCSAGEFLKQDWHSGKD